MSDRYMDAVEALSRVPGIRGALVVDAHAGVPVVAELAEDVDGAAVAALATSLFRRSSKGARSAAFGALDILQLEAEEGHVLVAGAGDFMVVAVAERDAQLGLVRLEARKAAEGLE